MSRTATATASAKVSSRAKAERNKTGTATGAVNDLDTLASEALGLEQKEREQFNVSNVTYVSIVGRMSQATMKSKSGYIPGASIGDIVTSTKEVLGQEVTVTVLGIFKLYGEFEADTVDPKTKKKIQGALKRYVMPNDAMQIKGIAKEVGLECDNFNISLPNGHSLRPMHWVYLYLHDRPDITNAIFSLRSTGNKVAFELAKMIQQSGVSHSVELRFTLTHREESNEQGEWYAADFIQLSQRNCTVRDGKFDTIRGGLTRQELADVLKLSNEQRKAYNDGAMVSSIDVKSLFGTGNAYKALPAGKDGYKDDDDEETTVF
jgi:hypothetical protein